MLHRITYGFVGALAGTLAFLPLGITFSMGGHSLMYTCMLGFPVGLFIGLALSDYRRSFKTSAIVKRTMSSMPLFALVAFGCGALFGSTESPLYFGAAWLLLPIICPILTAVFSEGISKEGVN